MTGLRERQPVRFTKLPCKQTCTPILRHPVNASSEAARLAVDVADRNTNRQYSLRGTCRKAPSSVTNWRQKRLTETTCDFSR